VTDSLGGKTRRELMAIVRKQRKDLLALLTKVETLIAYLDLLDADEKPNRP
jgi:hypothetical protein